MADGSRKKNGLIAIYEILKKYSSKDRTLKNSDIIKYLQQDYGISLNRNTIKNNLAALQEFYGDNIICWDLTERQRGDGNDNFYTSKHYLEREETKDILTDEEIKKLIDVCLYARNLTYEEANHLNRKLHKMMTKAGSDTVRYMEDIPIKQFNMNRETSKNLRILREVIAKNGEQQQQWVTFHFNYYNEKKELVPLKDTKGNNQSQIKEYKVLPIRICEANHKYYLVCTMEPNKRQRSDQKDNPYKLYHYRIDLMTHLKAEKSMNTNKELEDAKKEWSAEHISDYISSHLYMFYDEPTRIYIEVPRVDGIINLTFLADAFGVKAQWHTISSDEEGAIVEVKCSPNAMKVFLMQYADKNIRVVNSTTGVKEKINEGIRNSCEKMLELLSKENEE